MNGNSSSSGPRARRSPLAHLFWRNPRLVVRVVLGALLAANLVAAAFVWRPWDASPEQMQEQLARLRAQIRQRERSVARLRTLVEKSETARREGDAFLRRYFMDRRTASSTILSELKRAARQARVKAEQQTFTFQPIEGSDTLTMMNISGNYQGAYPDMMKFINLLDRSPRFLILDTLKAAPEKKAGVLNMNFKMSAFVVQRPRPAAPAGAATTPTGNRRATAE